MARRDFDGLRARRFKAAGLFARGKTQAEVARLLKVSRMTASRWERTWKRAGKGALQGAGRAGRLPRLSAEKRTAVEAALVEGPQGHGYATELWTLPRVAEVIRRTTGVRYHPGHVWRVLRGLGWSLQRPTTRARERDEEAVQRWIRQAWPALKKTPPAAAPASSLSTRADSRSGHRPAAPGHPAARRRS